MDFKNKVVLVTGASAGIGEATAVMFAARGARVALVGRSEDNLRAAGGRCAAQGGLQPLLLVADLATDEGCERVARETLKHFGRLDVLVNNAGVGCRSRIEGAQMKEFDLVFSTNVRGVYNLTRLLVPALIQSKGNIVNVSSVAGCGVSVGSVPYGMTKAALDHFTKLTALELAPKGVRVNTVSPGLTESKFQQRYTGCTEEQYQEFLKDNASCIPMGKVCSPENIASMIVHLASDASELVTGARVVVDGGIQFTMGGGKAITFSTLTKS